LGLSLLAAVMTLHWAWPAAMRVLYGDEVLYSSLPDDVQQVWQWSIVGLAIAAPYLFAPRPFAGAAVKMLPALVAGACGALTLAFFRLDYLKAMEFSSAVFGF